MDSSRANDVAIVLPLVISLVTILGTIVIHGLALLGTFHFVRREHQLGHTGAGFWRDVGIVASATLLVLTAHLVEITIWAFVFVFCGEFARFAGAFYHSAMNYTTLGYGDVVMTPSWKLFGPLEAADGMLMFGVSTAIIVFVIQLSVRTRFHDIPDL
jgi:Ion channel